MGFDVPGPPPAGGYRNGTPVPDAGTRVRPRPGPEREAPGEATGRHGTPPRAAPGPGSGSRDGHDHDRNGYGPTGYLRDEYVDEPDRNGHGRAPRDRTAYDPGDDDPDLYAPTYDDDRAGDLWDERDEYDTEVYDRDDYDEDDYDPSEYDPEPWPAPGHAGPATTRRRRRAELRDTDDPDADEADDPALVRRRRRAVPVRIRRRRWPWVVGGVALLAVVAVVAALTVPGWFQDSSAPTGGVASLDPYGSSTGSGTGPAPAPGSDPAQPPAVQVTYEVLGSGSARSITFGRGTGVSQVSGTPLPWQQTVPAVQGIADYTLTAQAGDGAGEISCRITVDGAVIAEQKADGDYAAVSCTGRR